MKRTEIYLGLISFSVFCHCIFCSLTTDYYKNLISQKTAATDTYRLPERNEEFRAGVASKTTKNFGSYDFIIVGAGSAGSVLATRLTECDKFKVLLLEAGGEEDDFSDIPAMFFRQQFTEKNWGYKSVPNKNCCLGMKKHQCLVPRGKAVGGSGVINALMYVRGNAEDYDHWARLGNPGWSYDDVLPYFIKSENSQIDGDPNYHGKGGLWNVEYVEPPTPIVSSFFKAFAELNMSKLDYNGKSQIGYSRLQFNTKRGRRQSTGTAFLNDARKRKNLTLVTKALVTKIKIDDSKTARGVEFVTKDQKFTATAKNEIILSGGAINTPQLLMLSGIGPKDHLTKLGIKVIVDLQVGEHLLDHPLFPGVVFRTNQTLPTYTLDQMVKQYLNASGSLTSPLGFDFVGFVQTPNHSVPTGEYIFAPTTFFARITNYDDYTNTNFYNSLNPSRDIIANILFLHEKSRGRVTLKSSDPLDFPDIDLNMFSEPDDIREMLKIIRFVLELSETKAFKELDAKAVTFPMCTEGAPNSDQYWECLVRHLSFTIFHPCGTTKMGPDPKTSVVDKDLKVHGIKRLRVVDAGVFPATISGHTNAPVVMAAEKIADVVKQEYGCKDEQNNTPACLR